MKRLPAILSSCLLPLLVVACSDADTGGFDDFDVSDSSQDSSDVSDATADVSADAIGDSQGVDASDTSEPQDSSGDAQADTSNDGADGTDAQGAYSDGILTFKELFDGNLINRIVIEVDYEQGAQPQNGSGSLDWSYVRANTSRLFQVSGASVEIPEQLNQLESFNPDEETYGETYTVDEIIEISEDTRDTADEGSTASIHVLYLDGEFEDDSGVRPNVLGVSLRGERLVAVFKPVIEDTGNDLTTTPAQRAFIEETTLIHEIGHAVGLVNTGVPMVEDHEDDEHPGHDVSEDCIMYWQNELSSGALDFVLEQLLGSSDDQILFCEASLTDIDTYSTPVE